MEPLTIAMYKLKNLDSVFVEQVSIENDEQLVCVDDGGRSKGSLKLVNEIDYRRNFLDPR